MFIHIATFEFFNKKYLYFEDETNEFAFIIDRNDPVDFKNIGFRERLLDFLEMNLESEFRRLYNVRSYQVLEAFDKGYYPDVYFEFFNYLNLDYLIQFIEENDIEYCPILYRILCNEKKEEE